MKNEFSTAKHTVILSDIHMAEAEPPHPGNSLWKRYKRPKYFVDRSFKRLLEYLMEQTSDPIELILNGDIFDFDSVMTMPHNPKFNVSWLEKKRGLSSEEEKSRFKMHVILTDHHIWLSALRDFILKGNRVVFIIGNHDMEMHWPSVQQDVVNHLDLPEDARSRVLFCEWFFISNSDTLVEHANQYDDYCLCTNPVNPLIKKRRKAYVRLPFGNLAGKYIMNGIGLMNPHVDSSFIKPFKEYLVFFFKYILRTQPFILWTWFWSAIVTGVLTVVEGLEPSLKDPLTMETRIEEIGKKANASPAIVRSLRAIHVHPAHYNPFKIFKELWLDRALLLAFLFFISFNVFSLINLFSDISFWWVFLLFLVVLPFFVFYAQGVESGTKNLLKRILHKVPLSAKIAQVKRVVHGHTHVEGHTWIEGVEHLNTGTWSSAFEDVECTKPFGDKVFAWIKPKGGGAFRKGDRMAELHKWLDPGTELIMPSPAKTTK